MAIWNEIEERLLDYQNYLEVRKHTRLLDNLKRYPVTAQDENAFNRLGG